MTTNSKIILYNQNTSTDRICEFRTILGRSQLSNIETVDVSFLQSANVQFYECSPVIEHNGGACVVILFLDTPHIMKAKEVFKRVSELVPGMPCVVVTDVEKPQDLIQLLKLGASDFIMPPLKYTNVIARLWRYFGEPEGDETVIGKLKELVGLQNIVGKNPELLKQLKKVPQVAKYDSSALIVGETGTGKELVARAIHYLSPRSSKPFIALNCGAIPSELAENELFGHEPGAYTGATNRHIGLVEAAEGGTLFLDDIDCFPMSVQAKLLRFLQEKEFRSLGSQKVKQANVRIITATNTNLALAVEKNIFRQDLLFRINVVTIELPPLRERTDDVLLLARYFRSKFSATLNKEVIGFSPDAIQKLMLYHWPGNIRELRNVIEGAIVLADKHILSANDLVVQGEANNELGSFKQMKAKVIRQFESKYIKNLLTIHSGNISLAAKAAQKNRRAFWELIRKHGIDVQEYKTT